MANELQYLPVQWGWVLFSILFASIQHNKFRLDIETSSWKIPLLLVLHNLYSDTSCKILMQHAPEGTAERKEAEELSCDFPCPIQIFDKYVIDWGSSLGKVIFNYPSY